MFAWPSQEEIGTYCLLGGSVTVFGFGVAAWGIALSITLWRHSRTRVAAT